MMVLDWRGASPDVVAPVFEQERQRWLKTLQWDSARAWREVERARTTWGLPGFLAMDDAGKALGSIFYLPDSNRYDIGGVTADSPAVTGALLDGVVARAASEDVGEVRCFVFESASNLGNELANRGFRVEPYLYLSASLDAARAATHPETCLAEAHGRRPAPAAITQTRATGSLTSAAWTQNDLGPASRLLRDAYAGEPGRIFAPEGTLGEWERYLRNLVELSACGELNARASRTFRMSGTLAGVAIVTAVAQKTAHLAQFAVHPGAQGKGVARTVLRQAFEAAAEQGFATVTLLVAESNVKARRLYESLGFAPRATFLSACRPHAR
jgi:ribosomal protein S18 acetylase RimI-like enzyme